MAIQNTTFRAFVEKLGATQAETFVGNEGDLFYDPNTSQLRISDGSTPGGIIVTGITTSGVSTTPGGIDFTLTGSDLTGTQREIVIVSVGNTFNASLSRSLLVPGTLEVSGISTLAVDGSETFIGGDLTVGGKAKATKFSTISDGRLKSNIKKIDNPLKLIDYIEGVTFNWKGDGSADVGLIAQDVERCLPDSVMESETGTKSVNYNGVVGLLVEAVKELSEENRIIKKDISEMKGLDK